MTAVSTAEQRRKHFCARRGWKAREGNSRKARHRKQRSQAGVGVAVRRGYVTVVGSDIRGKRFDSCISYNDDRKRNGVHACVNALDVRQICDCFGYYSALYCAYLVHLNL